MWGVLGKADISQQKRKKKIKLLQGSKNGDFSPVTMILPYQYWIPVMCKNQNYLKIEVKDILNFLQLPDI